MSDDVKPALSEREWTEIRENSLARIGLAHEIMRATLDSKKAPVAGDAAVALMALANAALPEGHPNKITRESVRILHSLAADDEALAKDGRDILGHVREELLSRASEIRTLAAKLAALLPPEGA